MQAGGYVGGGIGARASTAHHYQNLFNKIESGTKEFMDGADAAKKGSASSASTVKAQQVADTTKQDIEDTLNMTAEERYEKLMGKKKNKYSF